MGDRSVLDGLWHVCCEVLARVSSGIGGLDDQAMSDATLLLYKGRIV